MAIYDSQKLSFSGALKLGSRWPNTEGQESTYILAKWVELRHMSKSSLKIYKEIIHAQNAYLHALLFRGPGFT